MSTHLCNRLFSRPLITDTEPMTPVEFFTKFRQMSFVYQGRIGRKILRIEEYIQLIFKKGDLETFKCGPQSLYYIKDGFICTTYNTTSPHHSYLQFHR